MLSSEECQSARQQPPETYALGIYLSNFKEMVDDPIIGSPVGYGFDVAGICVRRNGIMMWKANRGDTTRAHYSMQLIQRGFTILQMLDDVAHKDDTELVGFERPWVLIEVMLLVDSRAIHEINIPILFSNVRPAPQIQGGLLGNRFLSRHAL
jgi:hypothetical protein